MKKKTWNIIYAVGMLLPLIIYLLSTIKFAVGGTVYNFVGVSSAVPYALSHVGYLMPISNLVALLTSTALESILSFGALGYLAVGLDLVFWLSCLHVVLDLFMFFTSMIHNFFEKWDK